MSRKQPKSHKSFVVTVSFETSHLANECLASAYEQVVPLVSRATAATANEVESEKTQPAIGDVVGVSPSDSGKVEPTTKSNRRIAL
jgi:hypothetical protein